MDERALPGCLIGLAVGDALGLPYEGLSAVRAERLLGPPDRHRFLLGRGMTSDDTEHACMTALAVIASRGDPALFARDLARRLRWWLLGAPGGIGLATLRATLRLWVGIPPDRSGVFSAGNGPAMRAPILGAAIDDEERLRDLIAASTRLTHSDPRAEVGALAVALATSLSRRGEPEPHGSLTASLSRLHAGPAVDQLLALIERALASVVRGEPTTAFARELTGGRSVSGYILHSVPVVLHAWLRHGSDYRAAVTEVIRCGGDTDTTAAIVGGIIGAGAGVDAIPREWLDGLRDWPRSLAWLRSLGSALAENHSAPARPPRLPVIGLLARNLVFDSAVLLHGFRRIFPPY